MLGLELTPEIHLLFNISRQELIIIIKKIILVFSFNNFSFYFNTSINLFNMISIDRFLDFRITCEIISNHEINILDHAYYCNFYNHYLIIILWFFTAKITYLEKHKKSTINKKRNIAIGFFRINS